MLGYVAWLERRHAWILAIAAACVVISVDLAAVHLPLDADLSDLLPANVPAIRDLRRLEARLTAKDRMVAIVVATDAADRAAAASELATEILALPSDLVARLDFDDRQTRAFLRAH